MANNQDKENWVEIEIDLDDDLYEQLQNLAVERNVTIDDIVNEALEHAMEKFDSESYKKLIEERGE